jgi:hypothetical protein
MRAALFRVPSTRRCDILPDVMRPIVSRATIAILLLMAVLGDCPSHGVDPNLKVSISKASLSPDGRYGVTVPTMQEYLEDENIKNVLVEVATKRPVAVMEGMVGVTNSTRYTADAQWSSRSDLLLWTVEGKWFEASQVLFKLNDGKVAWQLDIRKTVETAILKHTKEVAPETYAIKKAENAGNGSAYPEGFSVFIQLGDEERLDLPLAVHASMTSDPKSSRLPDNQGASRSWNLESELDGVVDKDGKFTVTQFKLLQKGSAAP